MTLYIGLQGFSMLTTREAPFSIANDLSSLQRSQRFKLEPSLKRWKMPYRKS